MDNLELHLRTYPGTKVTSYKLGCLEDGEFISVSRGTCSDREYIMYKMKQVYGSFTIYEESELIPA